MAKRSVAVSRATRDAQAILGVQVKQARLARGWTQASLAERIGVDARTLVNLVGAAPTAAGVDRDDATETILHAVNRARS
jgi:ribosome-binding protein aMBF1 (putative translation factor)